MCKPKKAPPLREGPNYLHWYYLVFPQLWDFIHLIHHLFTNRLCHIFQRPLHWVVPRHPMGSRGDQNFLRIKDRGTKFFFAPSAHFLSGYIFQKFLRLPRNLSHLLFWTFSLIIHITTMGYSKEALISMKPNIILWIITTSILQNHQRTGNQQISCNQQRYKCWSIKNQDNPS